MKHIPAQSCARSLAGDLGRCQARTLQSGMRPASQVGFVTVICATCFTIRAVIVAWSALDKKDADLDVWQHPLLDIIYYSLVEIVPSALVLFILRKLVRFLCSPAGITLAISLVPQCLSCHRPQPGVWLWRRQAMTHNALQACQHGSQVKGVPECHLIVWVASVHVQPPRRNPQGYQPIPNR